MSASQTANCQTDPSAVPASAGELLELADRLHSCVEQLRAGDTQAMTSAALSRLVIDAAHLYAGACLAAGREIDIAPERLAEHAAELRRVPAGDVYGRSTQDGGVHQLAPDEAAGLDRCRPRRRPQRVAAAPDGSRLAGLAPVRAARTHPQHRSRRAGAETQSR